MRVTIICVPPDSAMITKTVELPRATAIDWAEKCRAYFGFYADIRTKALDPDHYFPDLSFDDFTTESGDEYTTYGFSGTSNDEPGPGRTNWFIVRHSL